MPACRVLPGTSAPRRRRVPRVLPADRRMRPISDLQVRSAKVRFRGQSSHMLRDGWIDCFAPISVIHVAPSASRKRTWPADNEMAVTSGKQTLRARPPPFAPTRLVAEGSNPDARSGGDRDPAFSGPGVTQIGRAHV